MLEIYIYGPTESGFLDLYPGTTLDVESTADIFDEDLSTGEFSLPGDLPWTEKNQRLTGFAERFVNFDARKKSFKCTVYDAGFPELTSAKLTIIAKDGNFAGTRGKFSFNIAGTKGLFGTRIKNKKLQDLNLGEKISFDTDSRTFAEAVMKGGFPQHNFITFVPVAIESFFDTGRADYDGEFLAKDTVNTVIITGSGADGWKFGRPQSGDASTAAEPGTEEYADYRTIPFIKTKYLLRKVFELAGFRISGEFFESAEYDHLVTFNNYAIENYSPSHYDFNRAIFPFNHVPDMFIIDYLKGILMAFSMYAVFTGDNEVKLVFRKNLKKEKSIFSLNGICAELFSSTSENQDENDGYKLTYNWNGDDYVSDRVKDLKDKNLVATVQLVEELANITLGRQLTTDDIAFVQAENLYYQVADATVLPVLWDCFAEALDDYVYGAGDRTVDIPISTLCTYAELQESSGLLVKRDYVGSRMTGSYLNNKGILVKSECPNKIFFATRRLNSSNVLVPFSYNHNRDAGNAAIETFSLAWKPADGMANVFHNEWQLIRQNQEPVKTSIKADRRILANISESNFLEINGTLFLLSKQEKTLPLPASIDVELVAV